MASKDHSEKNAEQIKSNTEAARKNVLKLNYEAKVRAKIRSIAKNKTA